MTPAPGNGTILLVEDDQGLRLLLQMELESLGFRVIDYASAEEALTTSFDGVDLAVLDYNLPGRNGLELLQRLRATRGEIPALVISSERDLIRHPRWPAKGATLLAKPFCRASFLASISGCLTSGATDPGPV